MSYVLPVRSYTSYLTTLSVIDIDLTSYSTYWLVAAAGVMADTFTMEMDAPIPGFDLVKPWMPKVNVGGDSGGDTFALQAIVKKEISTRRGDASRRRSLQPLDRHRLEASIPPSAHRALRMLCANAALGLDIVCPVNTAAGEFACARISNVRLDIGAIPDLVNPILRKLVNPPENNAIFDIVAVPLSILDERIPGISDVAGTKINLLDIAETFLGKECGAPTLRIVLSIWRGMSKLAELFSTADGDGILIAGDCYFKPGKVMTCTGGASDLLDFDGTRRMLELAQEMEEVFPTHDLSGERITAVHTHYRRLNAGCTTTFIKPNCDGTCLGCEDKTAETQCKVRQLQCKGEAATGVMFPFMTDPASALNLFIGGDIQLLEFRPPTLEFIYTYFISIPLYTDGVFSVTLELIPFAYVTLDIALVSRLEFRVLLIIANGH